jgi:formylglycine-generating enzyme required for sulfatase activity
VTLAPFLLSKYELTQGQWLRMFGNNPSTFKTPMAGGIPITLSHPVELVSWVDCARLLPRVGLQLPTEAQWEYACRAGTQTPWWCGKDVASIQTSRAGNIADLTASRFAKGLVCTKIVKDGHYLHAPVGSFAANRFGLHDVLGNVWEWCRDGYGKYDQPVKGVNGFRHVPRAKLAVYRGGGFTHGAKSARSTERFPYEPDSQSSALGVRPARGIAIP